MRKRLIGLVVVVILIIAAGVYFAKQQKTTDKQIVKTEDMGLSDQERDGFIKRIDSLKDKIASATTDQQRFTYNYSLAGEYRGMGDLQQAKNTLLEALKYSPDNLQVYQELLMLAQKMNDSQAVKKFSEKIAELSK